MKKILTALCILALLPFAARAQFSRQTSVNVYGGYTFQDKVNFDLAYTEIQPAFQWGAGVEYFPGYNTSIELKYMRMATSFPLYTNQGTKLNPNKDRGAQDFVLLGGNWYWGSIGAKALPFFGASAGIGILSGENNSGTNFAWDAKLGLKVMTKSKVSFKVQAYVQSIISAFGNDYWWYAPGVVYAVTDYATIFQFGLGGAICLDFKK